MEHGHIIKYFSLFSGIGGFEYGMQTSNKGDDLICVGYSEIDKYADSIYRRQFPSRMVKGYKTHKPYGDVTKIRTSDLPDFDLLVGGFPCQAFSVAGKEEGLMTPEELSFLKSQGFSKTKDPDIFYSKTLKVYYLTTKEKLSRQYLRFSPVWGMMLNGRYLTAKTMEYPKTVKGYSLKDILERDVEEKYYLKKEMADRVLKN